MNREIIIPRISYRYHEAAAATGASVTHLREAVARGEIRAKKRGATVFLSAEDVERVFGFDGEPAISDEVAEWIAKN